MKTRALIYPHRIDPVDGDWTGVSRTGPRCDTKEDKQCMIAVSYVHYFFLDF
jgi:hypothetical protein